MLSQPLPLPSAGTELSHTAWRCGKAAPSQNEEAQGRGSPGGSLARGAHLSWRCLVASALCSSSMTRLGGSGRWTAVRCGDPVGVDSCPRRGGSVPFGPGPWKSTAWPAAWNTRTSLLMLPIEGTGCEDGSCQPAQLPRRSRTRPSLLVADTLAGPSKPPPACHKGFPDAHPKPSPALQKARGVSHTDWACSSACRPPAPAPGPGSFVLGLSAMAGLPSADQQEAGGCSGDHILP